MFLRFAGVSVLVLLLISAASAADPVITPGKKVLPLPGESFQVDGHDAFVILPEKSGETIPWVWYAPTLRGLPAKSEVWMFRQFLANGIAVAGIDVGESYGSPDGTKFYTALYSYLVGQRRFSRKPCLLARSRGGLMLYSWAADNPDSVGGVAGIYPVCSIVSYPGVANAAPAYGMTASELESQLQKYDPLNRIRKLAETKVPVFHIHGDSDRVVPLEANSAALQQKYSRYGGPVEIQVFKGQGHNMWDGWFTSQRLVDFVIARAHGSPLKSPAADNSRGPIAHWAMDDQGAVARDSVGSHHGRYIGATPTKGRVDGAREFVRARGDHVVIPYSKDLAISTFTVSAWVLLTKPPTFSGILGTRHGGEHTFDLKVNAAKVHGDIGNGSSWIETAVNFYADDRGRNGQGGDLQLNRWFHIVYVIDAGAQECRLYLDADLKKTIPFEGTPILMTPVSTMHIGHSSGTEFMDGIIDDVKIWNRPLTIQQVNAEYAGR